MIALYLLGTYADAKIAYYTQTNKQINKYFVFPVHFPRFLSK